VDSDDPFSRELRSARDRIAELQRRSAADRRPEGALLPEALAELDGAIEELSVTGQELHEQTVELTATRRALESERERYQALFEFAPVGYLVTDPVARILQANRAAAALLDVDQRFLVGKPLAAYVASEDRWEFRSTVNLLRRAGGNRIANLPVQFRRRSGGVVNTAVTVQPVRNREGALKTLRWLLRDLAPSEPNRLVVHGELARRPPQPAPGGLGRTGAYGRPRRGGPSPVGRRRAPPGRRRRRPHAGRRAGAAVRRRRVR
jgi:PAS domain S-box-containing protein